MPMIDRGVDVLGYDDLHANMSGILASIELVLSFIFPALMYLILKYDIYREFPASMYRWIITLDWFYGITMGAFRWLKGNPLYDSMAWPATNQGCRAAVFLDTFCQLGILYTNTVIVSTVFYAVYFKQRLSTSKDKYHKSCVRGFWFFTIGVCIITITGEVHNYVGWCTADSASVIIKELLWFLFMVIQVTMIIPTNYIIFKSSKRNRIGNGTYIRFLGIIFTQFVGLFPIMAVEFFGLARKVVPSWIMWAVIILFPGAHFIDFLLLSVKLWPIFLKSIDTAGHCNWIAELVRDSVDERSEEGRSNNSQKSQVTVGSIKSENTFGSSDNDSYGSETASNNGSEVSYDDTYSQGSGEGSEFTGYSGTMDSTSVISGMSGNSSAWKQYEKSRQSGSAFDKIPFWLHLSITIFIPFALLFIVCLIMIISYEDEVTQANAIRSDIELTSKMSNFVHESQKERGATGVFLGSKGSSFECEIKAQYILTSVQKSALQLYLDFEFANVRLVTKSTFLHALIFMLGMDDHRAKVQLQDIQKNDGIGFYTEMNMFFIGIVAEVCRDSKLGESIQHKMYANLAFFMGKEQAGIERAKGTVPFGQSTWPVASEGVVLTAGQKNAYRSFVEVVSKQDTFIEFYEIYVEGADRQFYIETMDDVSVQNAAAMRTILLEANTTKLEIGQSNEWFNNMTSKIGLIREVERTLAGALTIDASDVVDISTDSMMLVVITLALVLITDGLMILGLARTSNALKNFKGSQRRKKRKSSNMIMRCYSSTVDMNFTYQVLISVLGCGVGLVVISWLLLQQQVEASQSASATLDNMHLQFYLSDYIHETQKERGATGVYMSSDGKIFGEEMTDQRLLTDVKRAQLDRFLLEYVDYESLQDFASWVSLREDYMANIPATRINIWKIEIATGAALGFYTKHNLQIVDIAREIARRASGGSIESRLLAYLGFMYMKEKAGNERAVGSIGFSSSDGTWGNTGAYRKFVSLVAIQQAASAFFDTFGTGGQKEMFKDTASIKGSRVANDMRISGLENNQAKMLAIIASQWYGNITEKINAWRTVEIRIALDLQVFFDALDETANSFVIGVTSMLAVLFCICVFVIQKGIRLLLNSRAYNMYQERIREARNKQKASNVDNAVKETKEQKTQSSSVAV